MCTKQSVEFEKQESTWVYLLHQHQQAQPLAPQSAKSSLSLPPLVDLAPQSTLDALCDKPPTSPRLLLLPPRLASVTTMKLSYQDKSNDLVDLTMQDSTSLKSVSSHYNNNKRTCFPKKCDFPMCKNSSRSRGFCYSHGGGRRCRVDGCSNGAVSRDLCKRHGGGRRCRIAGCTSSSESGGLCYSHGGGRRCNLPWCSARAKKGGYCALHFSSDLTPRTDRSPTSISENSSSTDPNVIETLLSLANDQESVTHISTLSNDASVSSLSTIKSAYDIASLLN